jgi:hypothetical protein
MGAIVLTGAVVGAGSLVGAGALVREGQVVPPGSLVLGAPAKIVGQVTAEHTAAIRSGVDHYVELGQAYRAKGYAASFPSGSAGLVQRAVLRDGDVHWDALLSLLRTTPARVAQVMGQVRLASLRAHPVATAWSALETLCHLRDVEVDVYAPRLAEFVDAARAGGASVVVLTGRADVDRRNAEWLAARDYAHAEPDAALAAFAEARAATLAVLARLGPADRAQGAIHPSRGPITLYEQVERIAEHDLGHLRQIERALAPGAA